MSSILKFQESQRQFEYEGFKKELKSIGDRRRNDGKKIIELLWSIYSKQYYITEEGYETSEEENGWRKYCDEVIAPFFEGDDYFNDFPAIMDTVLRFVHEKAHSQEPIRHPATQAPITVQQLIDRPGMVGKLITASQKAGFCKEDAQRIDLVQSVVTGTREDVQQTGERIQRQITPIQINYTILINADGTTDFVFRNLNQDASKLFTRVIENGIGKAALELHLV